jgi:acyl-CoA thioesterase
VTLLDDSWNFQRMAPGVRCGCADPRYAAVNGVFGGSTAGLLLAAIIEEAGSDGAPSALTVHFLKGVAPDAELTLETERLGATRSLMWLLEGSGRPLDAPLLTLLSDIGPPRVFYVSSQPRPSATVTLSAYFHATPEELAVGSGDYVLSDMVGTRIEQSTAGSRTNLWSRSGVLLATAEQLAWFR